MNKVKSQFISFNKGSLILKCDKYDPTKNYAQEKINESLLKCRPGDENWIGSFFVDCIIHFHYRSIEESFDKGTSICKEVHGGKELGQNCIPSYD